MKPKPNRPRPYRVFVLLIDDMPTLAFLSSGHVEALQLRQESWLKEDLAELFSGGKALWRDDVSISVRAATEAESETYRSMTAGRDDALGDLMLAYLVPIDPPRDATRIKPDVIG